MKTPKSIVFILITICMSCSKDPESLPTDGDIGKYYEDKEVETIFENDPENGINVIFLGDAYLQEDLERTSSKYRDDAIKSIEFLFNSSPFREYQEHFNAYIIYAESSIEITSNGIITNYPFGGTPEPITSITNYEAVNQYVYELHGGQRTEKDLILMGLNNLDSGSAFLGGNVAVFGTFGSDNFTNTVFNTMLHEVGHAFASLGDEYINPNLNLFSTDGRANLDVTDDLDLVKWSHFIGLEAYPEVGAFEGGGYEEFGIWRPEFSSIMRGNIGSHFNAPSREAIVKRILSLKGIEYDFETFKAIDSNYQTNRLPAPVSDNAKNFNTTDKSERANMLDLRNCTLQSNFFLN